MTSTVGRIVSNEEFLERLLSAVGSEYDAANFVTGPGRSGAVAAVYLSHMLRIPFLPFGSFPPIGSRVLVADTARLSGRTMRKAMSRYREYCPLEFVAFEEPPRVSFWYEACNPKPQHYRHEKLAA